MMRYPLLFAALALSVGCACYAQKVTVDPNTGGAAQSAGVDASDTRLAHKITFEAWHTPIKTILADLSKSTGVTLNTGFCKMEWQVRDRRMNVYVKDVTLAQLMNSIARVMKFKWSCNEDINPPTYRLVADRRLLAKLQAESAKREAELKREEVKRRTSLIQTLAKVADASSVDLEKLKETDPYLYVSASTGMAKMVTQMFEDMPKLKDIFVSANQAVVVGAGEFPKTTQQIIASAVRGFCKIDTRKIPGDLEQRMGELDVHFDCVPKPFEYEVRRQLTRFATIDAKIAGGDHYIGDLCVPESGWGVVRSKTSMWNMEGEQPPETYWTNARQALAKDDEETEYYLMFDPVEEHSKDEPGLDEKLQLRVSSEDQKAFNAAVTASGQRTSVRLNYELLLKTIARAAKMNLVSDSYSVVPAKMSLLSDRYPVVLGGSAMPADGASGEVLGRLADTYVLNWNTHGSTLEIRRRDWFRRRSSQIPDEWLKPWQDQLKRDGMLTLDSYMIMAALTDEQIEENVNCDPLLDQAVGFWHTYSFNKGFARLYTQLSGDQRGQLLTKQGLDPRTLGPGQWDSYAGMFSGAWHDTLGSEVFADPAARSVVLTGTSTTNTGGSTTYKFVVSRTLDDGKTKTDTWTIPLHKVVRPEPAVQSK